ncbi:MAG: Gfo/Idh/MocA family oxidoreductase [Kiritimatiellia bacterium]|jgi:predicted dehydrogenase|nr:Gfo/Idh/MocA family oxidoreductase [Kiritimatiellia bacterium]
MRVGIAGFGFMGRMHYGCWKKVAGAEVAALCDRDRRQFEQSAAAAGNVQGADVSCDYGDAGLYEDFATMLDKARPDAVDITLPTFLHVPMATLALSRGIHVLCEKPMALHTAACDELLAAWRAAPQGTELMIGQCLRFRGEYVYAKRLIESNTYGRVIAARFGRYSQAPGWSRDGGKSWFFDESRSGGVALDLHIHDTDMVHYLFGMPQAVTSSAYDDSDGTMIHISTLYDVGGPSVVAEGGWGMSKTFGFERSFQIAFERATLVMAMRRQPEFCLYPMEGEPVVPELPVSADAYQNEINWFADKISGRAVEPVTSPEACRDSVRIVDAEKRSARSGTRVSLAE